MATASQGTGTAAQAVSGGKKASDAAAPVASDTGQPAPTSGQGARVPAPASAPGEPLPDGKQFGDSDGPEPASTSDDATPDAEGPADDSAETWADAEDGVEPPIGTGRRPAPSLLPAGGLFLRLMLRARSWHLIAQLLLAAAGCGTSYLLLVAFGHALDHPGEPGRAAWCAVPLVAVAQLAVAVVARPIWGTLQPSFAALGVGRSGVARVAAFQAVVLLAPGSLIALGLFLALRPKGGSHSLPVAGTLTLLAVVPLLGALACALVLWPPRSVRTIRPVAGSLLGLAALALGLVLGLAAHSASHSDPGTLALPGGLAPVAPQVLAAWGLLIASPVLLGPGLLYGAGHVLAAHRPGAVRLLVGRILRVDARRIGRPLGTLSAVLAGGTSCWLLRTAGSRLPGPFTLLAAAILLISILLTLAYATARAQRARHGSTALLAVLGGGQSLVRTCALLRTGVVLTVFLPLTAALVGLIIYLHG